MAGAVVGVTIFTGASREAQAHGPNEQPRVYLDGGLLTTNRDSLRVCEELSPSLRANREEIAGQLNAGLKHIQGHDRKSVRFAAHA